MGNLVPKGWAYPKLKAVVKYQKGKKPKILKDEPFSNSEPYLDIKAFEKDEIRRYADVDSSHLIHEKEIGIVWDGARSGWVGMNKKGAVGSTIAILRPLMINEIYLFRFLQSKFNYINENTRGSGIPHVDPQVLWDIDFPLPPRAEQDRIVAKVDALMTQHAAIQQAMYRIPQLLKDFRQQVLTQAVTGKLTEEWRAGKELEEWKVVDLEFVANIIDPHPSHRMPPIVQGGVPYVSIKDVGSNGKVNLDEARPVANQVLEDHIKRYELQIGDFGFGKVGTLGKPFLLPEFNSRMYALSYNIILIQPRRDCVPKFIFYFMDSPIMLKKLREETKATSQPALGIKKARLFPTPLPSFLEQQEIVRRVESLFEKATAIEQRYEQLKSQIDTLPQSILHKAFKGELVEQLDSDGSAMQLLEEIEGLKREKKNSVS
ncbi:MAG: type I restriction enzyme S subunit [Cyclobacteriaceae bacterium]|jgi:type I restriction enzyme S subunit